jgi:glycosyltransferase involved in cell wall biosynthesis
MVKEPQVSFIIPVLNGERDIERCLLSVRNLNFPKEQYEVLIMDNGSTDKTHQIVRRLGFELHVVPKVKVGALRNGGVALTHGNYLAFVDADVELTPCWLQAGLAAFEDPQVVAAGCFPRVPQPATWVQQTWDVHQRGRQRERRPVAWLPSMNLLARRDVFLKIGGFNEQLETAEDVDLCYRLGQHGTILCIPDMEAIHWGEARDIRSFWRKEAWRGIGNLRGVGSHGLRRDELPSIGYPIYMLCCIALFGLSCGFDAWRGQFTVIPITFVLLVLPALVLAVDISCRTQRLGTLPRLFLLYLLYGLARGYSIIKAGIFGRRCRVPHVRSEI